MKKISLLVALSFIFAAGVHAPAGATTLPVCNGTVSSDKPTDSCTLKPSGDLMHVFGIVNGQNTVFIEVRLERPDGTLVTDCFDGADNMAFCVNDDPGRRFDYPSLTCVGSAFGEGHFSGSFSCGSIPS